MHQLVISKTLSVSLARKLRSIPGFPHISLWEIYHARPALYTVFSTAQSRALNNALGILTITEIRMPDYYFVDMRYFVWKDELEIKSKEDP